jgi:hypothetical protein
MIVLVNEPVSVATSERNKPKWAILTYATPVYITVVTVRESYNVVLNIPGIFKRS